MGKAAVNYLDEKGGSRIDAIYQALFKAIMAQELKPGTKLSEESIGALFSVSRTIVRAALNRLHTESLVEFRQNRGAFVASTTPDEARQVFEARNAIEREIFHRLAAVITDKQLATLKQHLEDEHTVGAVRELTAGRGVDYVFECAGGESALQLMYDVVRTGGQAVMLGKVAVDQKVSLRFGSMMGEKRVIRSSYGGARPQRDFPWLAQAYLDGKLRLDELISMRLPLDRINDGFAAMTRGEIVRAVVTMSH